MNAATPSRRTPPEWSAPDRSATDLHQRGRPVVIAAGGTGGHFFPAEALAAALLARGRGIALFTDARSGGMNSAVFAGHPVHVLRGGGIAGAGATRMVRSVAALAAGSMQARAVLRRLHAAAIVGFGGYPSVAPVMGSRMLHDRPPVVLHEQNAVLGRANRMLAKRADCLALSFAATSFIPARTQTLLTGNPVRPAIAALWGQGYALPGEGRIRLLILGGSLGARILSEIVPAALATLPEPLRARLDITQQCRAEDLFHTRVAYLQAGIAASLDSFFTDVAGLLARAHLVIARAGASTVAELAVAGRPAILVPLPGAIDDHQAANAMALGSGAWMLRQGLFSADSLAALLATMFADQSLLATAAASNATQGRAFAAAALADLVEQTIASRTAAP